MGGEDRSSGRLFSYVDLEARVPAKHPLRVIRAIVNDVLGFCGVSSRRFIRVGGARRSRRSSFFGRCCYRHSTRFSRSASLWNSLSSICCTAGSSGSAWMIPCRTRARSAITGAARWDRLMEADVSARFLAGCCRAPQGTAAFEPGPLLGGRHADRGLGVDGIVMYGRPRCCKGESDLNRR